ncbi:uncharacterized protein AB675_7119 [Cyphellophora attinorum]|uniref:Uncharacterized protein n=1 Tax=Cyphellophora attinorum TaxID=1664694 RepID=A0A0N0NQG0_9EURO|nr:uncharacterized protein AB675_7119 [Phialophora attinorum]KPI43659.1 hypothetical protein AB675_7119 [Phialophora attinorum]
MPVFILTDRFRKPPMASQCLRLPLLKDLATPPRHHHHCDISRGTFMYNDLVLPFPVPDGLVSPHHYSDDRFFAYTHVLAERVNDEIYVAGSERPEKSGAFYVGNLYASYEVEHWPGVELQVRWSEWLVETIGRVRRGAEIAEVPKDCRHLLKATLEDELAGRQSWFFRNVRSLDTLTPMLRQMAKVARNPVDMVIFRQNNKLHVRYVNWRNIGVRPYNEDDEIWRYDDFKIDKRRGLEVRSKDLKTLLKCYRPSDKIVLGGVCFEKNAPTDDGWLKDPLPLLAPSPTPVASDNQQQEPRRSQKRKRDRSDNGGSRRGDDNGVDGNAMDLDEPAAASTIATQREHVDKSGGPNPKKPKLTATPYTNFLISRLNGNARTPSPNKSDTPETVFSGSTIPDPNRVRRRDLPSRAEDEIRQIISSSGSHPSREDRQTKDSRDQISKEQGRSPSKIPKDQPRPKTFGEVEGTESSGAQRKRPESKSTVPSAAGQNESKKRKAAGEEKSSENPVAKKKKAETMQSGTATTVNTATPPRQSVPAAATRVLTESTVPQSSDAGFSLRARSVPAPSIPAPSLRAPSPPDSTVPAPSIRAPDSDAPAPPVHHSLPAALSAGPMSSGAPRPPAPDRGSTTTNPATSWAPTITPVSFRVPTIPAPPLSAAGPSTLVLPAPNQPTGYVLAPPRPPQPAFERPASVVNAEPRALSAPAPALSAAPQTTSVRPVPHRSTGPMSALPRSPQAVPQGSSLTADSESEAPGTPASPFAVASQTTSVLPAPRGPMGSLLAPPHPPQMAPARPPQTADGESHLPPYRRHLDRRADSEQPGQGQDPPLQQYAQQPMALMELDRIGRDGPWRAFYPPARR